MKTTIGLQGYSVRDLLDADEKGTIKKLKQQQLKRRKACRGKSFMSRLKVSNSRG